MLTNKRTTAMFGIFVVIDWWEVYTTSTVNVLNNVNNSFNICIGHHNPSSVYNVALPCSAFSESNCFFLNITGTVQRTVKAVKPDVKDKDMLHTTDVILCSLLRYLLNIVKFAIHKSNQRTVSYNTAAVFRTYSPYSVGYISHAITCKQLLLRNSSQLPGIMYVMQVRYNNATDVISRRGLHNAVQIRGYRKHVQL